MPSVGIERTITAFERAKTVHALGRAATVIRFSGVISHLVWLMAYGFVGAGVPEHYDRIRPIVHPL
jgi:hypothetical protein